MGDRRHRIRQSMVLLRCRSRFDRPFSFLSGLVFLFVGSAYTFGPMARAPLSHRCWHMDFQPPGAHCLQRVRDNRTAFFGGLGQLVACWAGLVALRSPKALSPTTHADRILDLLACRYRSSVLPHAGSVTKASSSRRATGGAPGGSPD